MEKWPFRVTVWVKGSAASVTQASGSGLISSVGLLFLLKLSILILTALHFGNALLHIKLRTGKRQYLSFTFFFWNYSSFPIPQSHSFISNSPNCNKDTFICPFNKQLLCTTPSPQSSVRKGKMTFESHESHLQGINHLMGEEIKVCVQLKKKEVKWRKQQHKLNPEDMIPGQMSGLENMHYKSARQAHKWTILLGRGSTKKSCLCWVLKDGENVDTQMEWGGGGISGSQWGKQSEEMEQPPSIGGEPPRGEGRSRVQQETG